MHSICNEPEKKKRGRKPKHEKEGANCVPSKETEKTSDPQILHLNISRNISSVATSSNEMTNMYEYNPELKVPNAYNECDNFMSQPFELIINNPETSNSNVKILLQNIEKQPLTNIACYWCCHKFDHQYLGLPIKYKNDTFEVYGCFCSFECMCAYNFYSNENNHNTWDIYNLINIMANKMNYIQYVYPAPPRKCLNFFGGYMTIEEFRKFKDSKKIINVNKTPFVVMVDQIEEINDYYHKQQPEIIFNFDKERMENLEKKLNLQNEETIQNNFKNTLNASMNIV
jgi:hypothetical protein